MNKKPLLLNFFFIFLFANFSFSKTCTSNAGTFASWAAITWTCTSGVAPPGCGDVMNIAAGTYVYVSADVDYSACATSITLNIYGTLDFNTNGVSFKLPAGSTLFVGSGGTIKKSFAGGGASTLISIGGKNVWTADAGTITGPTTLPIELLSFTAAASMNSVLLNWATASEINNDFYTVEKTQDGNNYAFVATVDGAGNSTSVLNYEAIDTKPFEGLSYYRLKQTDFNGKYTYSFVVPVNFIAATHLSFEIYPNPADGDNIHVAINTLKGEEVIVVVYDVNGKENYSKVIITEQSGENVFAVDPSSRLSSGLYFITATSRQEIYSKKLIVK